MLYQLAISQRPNPICRRCQDGRKVAVIPARFPMDPLIGDWSCPGEASRTNYSARQEAVTNVTVRRRPLPVPGRRAVYRTRTKSPFAGESHNYDRRLGLISDSTDVPSGIAVWGQVSW